VVGLEGRCSAPFESGDITRPELVSFRQAQQLFLKVIEVGSITRVWIAKRRALSLFPTPSQNWVLSKANDSGQTCVPSVDESREISIKIDLR
jgi:hypothetical protein